MAKNPRISENAVTGIAPITLYKNSKDEAFLDPRKYRSIDSSNLSSYLSSGIITSDIDYFDSSITGDFDAANNVPQLEDIEVVENTTYVDEKGITRGKLVIKVRNSSGKTLLGVDARKAILAAQGGQS